MVPLTLMKDKGRHTFVLVERRHGPEVTGAMRSLPVMLFNSSYLTIRALLINVSWTYLAYCNVLSGYLGRDK